MISIYLRPDKTQVVEASIRKNKTLRITKSFETDSFFSGMLSQRDSEYTDEDDCITELSNLFLALRKKVAIRSDEVYIVLPDFLFSVVDCFEFVSDDNLYTEVENATGESQDAFYISFPVASEPPAPVKKTVYAIHRYFIDRLTEAASDQHVTITSVEPASVSYFRSLSNWSLDHPIVEIFEDHASIVTYSPAGGIFRSDAPSLTAKNLRENTLKADSIISSAYAANDFSSSQSFSHMRTDAEYTLLCDEKSIFQYNAVKLRLPEQPPTLPSNVSHRFVQEEQVRWMPVIGTLFQQLDQAYSDASENPIYDDLPAFIHVQSANLLPDSARIAARNRQWQQIAKRLSKGVIAICVTSTIIEAGLAFYFNSAEISPSLQTEYDTMVSQKDAIEGELNVIKAAKREDFGVWDAYMDITRVRPQNCGFIDLSIGSNNPSGASAKKQFVKVNAIAQNEMTFQDFRAGLETIPTLSAPTISNIAAEQTSGYKRASIIISKAGGGDKKK